MGGRTGGWEGEREGGYTGEQEARKARAFQYYPSSLEPAVAGRQRARGRG